MRTVRKSARLEDIAMVDSANDDAGWGDEEQYVLQKPQHDEDTPLETFDEAVKPATLWLMRETRVHSPTTPKTK